VGKKEKFTILKYEVQIVTTTGINTPEQENKFNTKY
jgi:hypothetical protein